MRWVAPTEKDEANHQLEKRLWDAADQFRANSGLLDSGQLCISVVSEAELLYGVKAKGSPRALASMVADFLRRLHVLDWSRAAAQHYSHIRAKLEPAGTPIGNMDLMIAAHARSAGSTSAGSVASRSKTGPEIQSTPMNLCMAATYDPDPRAPLGFRIPFNAECG